MKSAIRVLICDDHPVVRQGLRWLVETEPEMEVVGEATDGLEAVEMIRTLRPDVTLMDLVMPNRDGLWAIATVTAELPDMRILVLTSFAEDEKIAVAIRSGALGYLLKDSAPDELLAAIREVAAGGAPIPPAVARRLLRQFSTQSARSDPEEALTEREVEVLALIAKGFSNQEIADKIVVSERTVRCHVSNILHKLHLSSRTQAALYAVRHGIADDKVSSQSAM